MELLPYLEIISSLANFCFLMALAKSSQAALNECFCPMRGLLVFQYFKNNDLAKFIFNPLAESFQYQSIMCSMGGDDYLSPRSTKTG